MLLFATRAVAFSLSMFTQQARHEHTTLILMPPLCWPAALRHDALRRRRCRRRAMIRRHAAALRYATCFSILLIILLD